MNLKSETFCESGVLIALEICMRGVLSSANIVKVSLEATIDWFIVVFKA